jgi:hypothetical protein
MKTKDHSMHTASLRAAFALTATILIGQPMSAQGAAPTMIPSALVNSVLDGFSEMTGVVRFVVGGTPEGWPKSLVAPSDGRIVGGAKFGPMLTTLYEFPRKRDAIGAIEVQLLKAGFSRADSAKLSSRSGFASSATGKDGRAFCGADGAVVVSQVDSTRTTRSITVVVVRDKEMSTACSSKSVPGFVRTPLKLPTLRPPAGVSATPEGYGAGGDNFEARVRVDTTLSADEVLAHYVKELATSGWKAVPAPVIGDGVALQQMSARDEKGEEWHGTLLVTKSRSQREVLLRMMRDRPEY